MFFSLIRYSTLLRFCCSRPPLSFLSNPPNPLSLLLDYAGNVGSYADKDRLEDLQPEDEYADLSLSNFMAKV